MLAAAEVQKLRATVHEMRRSLDVVSTTAADKIAQLEHALATRDSQLARLSAHMLLNSVIHAKTVAVVVVIGVSGKLERDGAHAVATMGGDIEARMDALQQAMDALSKQQAQNDRAQRRVEDDMKATASTIRSSFAQLEGDLLGRIQIASDERIRAEAAIRDRLLAESSQRASEVHSVMSVLQSETQQLSVGLSTLRDDVRRSAESVNAMADTLERAFDDKLRAEKKGIRR